MMGLLLLLSLSRLVVILVPESMREARIFPDAISHNVAVLHKAAGSGQAMVVVKADGYGHGIVTAAKAGLDGGASWCGTADISEALTLRDAGITAPILAWLVGPQSRVDAAIAADVDLGVSSLEQLRQVLSAASSSNPATIHLKIDSGMGRGGSTEAEWEELFVEAAAAVASGSLLLRRMFTHFAQTSADSDRAQAAVFATAIDAARSAGLEPDILHSSSSTPSIRTPEFAHSLVRLGISAYGVATVDEHRLLGLRPAMRLAGQVIQLKHLPSGHGVGYDHTYTTRTDTTMAVVPLGYADGIPRLASSAGPVSIGGKRFTIAGRVSMDQVSIDVGDARVTRGDWAVFFGDPEEGEPSVQEWADLASTIPYEILTGVGSRVRRVVQ
jgi:alanine racemase